MVEPQGRSRLVRKFSHTSVFDPRTFQTVAIRSSVACIKLILKCILLVYIILGDKLVFGKYNFLHGNLFWLLAFRSVKCRQLRFKWGPLWVNQVQSGLLRNCRWSLAVWLWTAEFCVSVVPALWGVKSFVQYLQNEDYCGQNNAKTEHQEWWGDVLHANTGKGFSITTAFRLLKNPVLVFSISYSALL